MTDDHTLKVLEAYTRDVGRGGTDVVISYSGSRIASEHCGQCGLAGVYDGVRNCRQTG